MNGAELAARYAFPPNNLGYCGGASFCSVLRDYLDGVQGSDALERELKKFRAHHAYLSLIARENGLKPFDLEVVKAFWTGNGLLRNVSRKALRQFIVRDLFAGKQKTRAKKLAENLPEGLVPHHSFNALYINFVTDKVRKSADNFDSCCVTAAKVLAISGNKAKVNRGSIALDEAGRFVIRQKIQTVALGRKGIRLIGKPETGDLVSVHWGMAIQRLGLKDAAALDRYTRMNMDAINTALKE